MRGLIALMGYEDANWGAAEWVAMSLMMLLFWGLLIGLVVWAVRSFCAGSESVQPQDWDGRSEEILAERFARGDIDEIEFQRRRGLLHAPGK
jgi:putative membrane protein